MWVLHNVIRCLRTSKCAFEHHRVSFSTVTAEPSRHANFFFLIKRLRPCFLRVKMFRVTRRVTHVHFVCCYINVVMTLLCSRFRSILHPFLRRTRYLYGILVPDYRQVLHSISTRLAEQSIYTSHLWNNRAILFLFKRLTFFFRSEFDRYG